MSVYQHPSGSIGCRIETSFPPRAGRVAPRSASAILPPDADANRPGMPRNRQGAIALNFTVWYIIVGLLLIGMALAGTLLKRLPLTTSLLYLLVGVALGRGASG